MKFLQPPDWPRAKGYSNGIATRGEMVFMAGIIGWNAQEAFETDDFAGQARQIFANIAVLLNEAGAKPEHLVRLTWYIKDRAEYLAAGKALGAAYREFFGNHYPVMAVIVIDGLIETNAKLEIEATAVIPD
ncbi:MAG: RidA family protein [Alphaproteobacteria bacterium]|jgi:enamine deaminase RidA (YjgF/YER057c/UK114 family)|nr:RidA family protein [Alphaproteobacteria bacterium]